MGGGERGTREKYAARRYVQSPQPQKSIGEYNKPTKPKVFISFHMDDEAQINLLRYQAEYSDQLEFDDRSLKEPFDERWKTQCTERIKKCDILIVAIGENTHEREAVDWEIRKAHELGIPVVGMRVHSDKNDKIPRAMKEHGDKVVPWNLKTIQSQLDKKT